MQIMDRREAEPTSCHEGHARPDCQLLGRNNPSPRDRTPPDLLDWGKLEERVNGLLLKTIVHLEAKTERVGFDFDAVN